MFHPIHKQVLIKAYTINPIENPEEGKNFLLNCVERLHMNPVTIPQCVDILEEGNEGLTGSINLATSHIAFHCWENSGLLMMDIYSCQDFDTFEILKYIRAAWDIEQLEYQELDRKNMFYDGEL